MSWLFGAVVVGSPVVAAVMLAAVVVGFGLAIGCSK